MAPDHQFAERRLPALALARREQDGLLLPHQRRFYIFLMRSPFDRDIKLAELEPTEYFKVLYPPAKDQEKQQAAAAKPSTARRDSTAPPQAGITPPDTAHPFVSGNPPGETRDTTQVAAAGKQAADSTLYGKDVQIDFSSYVFKETFTRRGAEGLDDPEIAEDHGEHR